MRAQRIYNIIVRMHNKFQCTLIELGDIDTYLLDVVSICHVLYLSLCSVGKPCADSTQTIRWAYANYPQRARTTEGLFVKSTPIFVMHTHKYGMHTLLARYAYARRTLWTRWEDVRSTQLNSYVGKVVRMVSFAIRYPYAELIRWYVTAP